MWILWFTGWFICSSWWLCFFCFCSVCWFTVVCTFVFACLFLFYFALFLGCTPARTIHLSLSCTSSTRTSITFSVSMSATVKNSNINAITKDYCFVVAIVVVQLYSIKNYKYLFCSHHTSTGQYYMLSLHVCHSWKQSCKHEYCGLLSYCLCGCKLSRTMHLYLFCTNDGMACSLSKSASWKQNFIKCNIRTVWLIAV